jgi:N-acetylmuramoyl-L-alanine amidase
VTFVRLTWRLSASLTATLLAAGCGTGAVAAQPPSASGGAAASNGAASTHSGLPSAGGPESSAPAAGAPSAGAPASSAPAGSGQQGSQGSSGQSGGVSTSAARRPLAGKTVGIDPGHNGRNKDDPVRLNHRIWNGRAWEACDTTGTETNAGYTEALFNWRVAGFLRADLRKDGARVVMTRKSNNGFGPCVDRRAKILNRAHANVSIDIHGDGGPASGRGFTVIEPIADGPNNKVIGSSLRFGGDVRSALLKYTRMPVSNYYGHDGLIRRDDLAGTNLATQPKILIETGNMRNATDARLLTATWFQKRLAHAFTNAIVKFLARH